MRNENGVNYLTIGEVSTRIGRSPSTIKNWYEWYEMQTDEVKAEAPLPAIRTDLNAKKTRFFLEGELPLFEVFIKGMKYGKVAEVSRRKWGQGR